MPSRLRAGIIGTACPPRAVCAALSALTLALSSPGAVAAEAGALDLQYEIGHGLRIGDTGITLGGYLAAEVRHPSDGRAEWRSSHASLFFWWEGLERLKVFGEIDQENLVAGRYDRERDDDPPTRRASLERLYLDWAIGDATTLRGGKFLTPIGRWNVSHADPLVWTTSRPLITGTVYPHNVTGLMVSGALGAADAPVRWWVYGSNGTEWGRDPRQDPFSTVIGARVIMPAGSGWQLGASLAKYEQRGSRGEQRSLAGVDALWARGGWEFSAEWLRTSVDRPGPLIQPEPGPGGPPGGGSPRGPSLEPRSVPSRGAYAQGVAPLAGRLYAVARVEWLRDVWSTSTQRVSTAGLVWRPNAAASFKLEYQWPGGPTYGVPEGWTASASLLF